MLTSPGLPCSHQIFCLHAVEWNSVGFILDFAIMFNTIQSSLKGDKIDTPNNQRFRSYILFHCCYGLQTSCLRFTDIVLHANRVDIHSENFLLSFTNPQPAQNSVSCCWLGFTRISISEDKI